MKAPALIPSSLTVSSSAVLTVISPLSVDGSGNPADTRTASDQLKRASDDSGVNDEELFSCAFMINNTVNPTIKNTTANIAKSITSFISDFSLSGLSMPFSVLSDISESSYSVSGSPFSSSDNS